MSLGASSKTSYLLVTLTLGGSTIKRTTNAVDVGDFVALPAMRVSGLHNSGGLDAKPITIDVAAAATWTGFGDGRSLAPVTLHLDEVVTAYGPSGSSSTTIHHAIGDYRLERAFRCPDRQAGLVRLVFAHHKARIKVPLGIVASPSCAWSLGDKTCGKDLTGMLGSGTVASIAGKVITLSDPDDAAVAGADAGFWHRGVIMRAGVWIGVREWEEGSYSFELVREPPADWLAAVVELRPGCDKTPATCAARFDNLERFGGFGIKIPAYNPTQEIP